MRLAWPALLAACHSVTPVETDDTDLPPDTDAVYADEMAAALWTDLYGHETWGRPDSWSQAPTLSQAHGRFLVRYDHVLLREWDGTGDAPNGSVSVVNEYDSETGVNLTGYAAMQKVAGYDERHSDWFWVRYLPDGTPDVAGRAQVCSDCHTAAASDFLFPDPPEGF